MFLEYIPKFELTDNIPVPEWRLTLNIDGGVVFGIRVFLFLFG
jgi:hypothetical protein